MLRHVASVVVMFLVATLVPAAVMWTLSSSVWAAAFAAAAGLSALIFAALRAEDSLLEAHQSPAAAPSGLLRSFDRATEDLDGPLPQLGVFSDPVPNALAIRGVLGGGTVLVSQGMLAFLDEEALRAVLRHCALECRSPGIRFRTFSAAMAEWTLRRAPAVWIDLFFRNQTGSRLKLNPVTIVPFLLVYPFAKFFISSSRSESRSDQAPDVVASAMRDLRRANRGRQSVISGASFLYLIDPWTTDMLFPLSG